MIPHKLQIKNFLSYGPDTQTIEFSAYHLICLSGKNGHGKSALLDAITWALWGQARKTSGNSKADAGLLHLGQKHMSVILEFEISNQMYRVRREFVQTKSKPFTSLDFGILKESDSIISLTDKTIKSTQEKIEKTIGISYDSFINSAFLRQGQSNEFSKKSPKERKEILANILQLQQFEDQKKIAATHAKALQQEYKTACSIQEHIQKELESLCNIATLYQEIEQKLETTKKQKNTQDQTLAKIYQDKEVILQQVKECELLEKQRLQINKQIQQIDADIEQITKIFKQVQQTQQTNNIKELEEKKKDLIKIVKDHQEKQEKRLCLKEEYLKLKEELSVFTTAYEKQCEEKYHKQQLVLSKTEQEYTHLITLQKQEEKAHALNKQEIQLLENELITLTEQSKSIKKTVIKLEQEELIFQEQQQQYQHMNAQQIILAKQLEELCYQNVENNCSLCEQTLTDQTYNTVAQKIKQNKESKSKELQALKFKTQAIKMNLDTCKSNLEELKLAQEKSLNVSHSLQERKKQCSKLSEKQKEHTENIKKLEEQKTSSQKNIQHIQKEIEAIIQEKNNITKTQPHQILHNALLHIEQTAKALGYNQQEHRRIQEEFHTLEQQIQLQQTHQEELEKQTERKIQLTNLQVTKQQLIKQQEDLAKQLEGDKKLQKNLQDIYALEQSLKKNINDLEQVLSQLLQEQGSLQQKQIKQKELFLELEKRSKDIKRLYQEMSDYQEIAKALGKDGIQALLIEQAIPEIEDEANEVLARLTNNQTQVFIESLRDLKKGGSKETLDIKISDSFGIRDYEMFSGGEAFRIDFALRIGISKLLARKAGTTLQTIVIDEGFGSQDEEGLQLIMDNIYKVQDDFAKVIIVSHLQEMKDYFPVQFLVEKKRSGSCISIHEQG